MIVELIIYICIARNAMNRKLLSIIFTILVIGGSLFTGCKKDPQINPPVTKPSVVATPPPVEITNSIYPNPCNGSFTITTNSNVNQTVKMCDITGRTIFNLTISGTTAIITDSLKAGIYVVIITNSKGTTAKRLVVVYY